MLKFAYHGTDEGATPAPSHPTGLHDSNHCCDVCNVRKVELSREKTRVNRARSRSRERGRERIRLNDNAELQSDQSMSRDSRNSDDTYSLDSVKTHVDCYRLEGNGPPCAPTLNDEKETVEQRIFNPFRRLRKAKSKERLYTEKSIGLPQFGDRRQSYNQTLAELSFAEEERLSPVSDRKRLYEPKISRNRPQSDFSANSKAKDARVRNTQSRKTISRPPGYQPAGVKPTNSRTDPDLIPNYYEGDVSPYVCNPRRRKSGSEVGLREQLYRRTLLENQHLSYSCERLFLENQELRHSLSMRRPSRTAESERLSSNESEERSPNSVKREWSGFFRKKKRSKSQEKLTFVGNRKSPNNLYEYDFDDDDWETKSMTMGRTPSVQRRQYDQGRNSALKKQWRKSRSCERLSFNMCENDVDYIRTMEHRSRRRSFERRIRESQAVLEPGKTHPTELVMKDLSSPSVKQANIRKTATACSQQDQIENTMFYAEMYQEHVIPPFYDMYQSSSDTTSDDSDTFPDPPYVHRQAIPCDFNSPPDFHRQIESMEGENYSRALRQVACAKRKQLFQGERAPHANETERRPTVNQKCNSIIQNASHSNAAPQLSKNRSHLNTNSSTRNPNGNPVDNLSQRMKYTSISSISTTLSTTSEDSADSGQGSTVDYQEHLQFLKVRGKSYSPIDAERVKDDKQKIGLRLSKYRENVPHVNDTSDYDSESGNIEINRENSGKSPTIKVKSSNASKNDDESFKDSAENLPTQRRRIRFVDF